MTTVTISLPETLKEFIDREVQTKGYGNVSEYVRSLLREAQAKASGSRLESLLLEGLESGHNIPLSQSFWRELKAEARKSLVKKKATRKTRSMR
ncbi:MAG TPA: ribbon-helix-helix domain-containing protein [Candidatus Angelobacter sp.]|jgi:antitoxin ParD1/3/4|nr:ribbon-helix-helix domain-containing protein [Candidatus Angelobacter sp.]